MTDRISAAEYPAQQAKKPKAKRQSSPEETGLNGTLKTDLAAQPESEKILESIVVKYPCFSNIGPDKALITTFEGNHYEITLTLKK